MKRNKWLRLAAGCLMAGQMLSLPACWVRKQQEKSEQRQTVSLRLQTDSFTFSGKRQVESESVSRWEMIRFSPPDSSGRQHVSAIVRNRTNRNCRSSAQDSLQHNIAETVRQEEDYRSGETTVKQLGSPAARWWWWAIGIVALTGSIARLRKKNQD